MNLLSAQQLQTHQTSASHAAKKIKDNPSRLSAFLLSVPSLSQDGTEVAADALRCLWGEQPCIPARPAFVPRTELGLRDQKMPVLSG